MRVCACVRASVCECVCHKIRDLSDEARVQTKLAVSSVNLEYERDRGLQAFLKFLAFYVK